MLSIACLQLLYLTKFNFQTTAEHTLLSKRITIWIWRKRLQF